MIDKQKERSLLRRSMPTTKSCAHPHTESKESVWLDNMEQHLQNICIKPHYIHCRSLSMHEVFFFSKPKTHHFFSCCLNNLSCCEHINAFSSSLSADFEAGWENDFSNSHSFPLDWVADCNKVCFTKLANLCRPNSKKIRLPVTLPTSFSNISQPVYALFEMQTRKGTQYNGVGEDRCSFAKIREGEQGFSHRIQDMILFWSTEEFHSQEYVRFLWKGYWSLKQAFCSTWDHTGEKTKQNKTCKKQTQISGSQWG